MYPEIDGINFEENSERLKVTLPVSRNWIYLIIYSILMVIGIGLMIGGLIFGFQIALAGERFSFVFAVMVFFFLLLLYPLLKYIFQQWQYNVTNREIIFIHPDEMIIRRPVSILGITKTYDLKFVKPMYFSQKYNSLAFDYGSQPVIFAAGLPSSQTVPLATYLNERYFPDYDEDDDE